MSGGKGARGTLLRSGGKLAFRPLLGHLPPEFRPVEDLSLPAVLGRHLLERAAAMRAAEERVYEDPVRWLAQAPAVARVALGSPGGPAVRPA
ncbi:MAG TPA: hypothetical protein DCM14_06345 [Clostridiales bacterium UBA8153]|nr:hypothetical protein [Clostridiales bacterium UBA8153]